MDSKQQAQTVTIHTIRVVHGCTTCILVVCVFRCACVYVFACVYMDGLILNTCNIVECIGLRCDCLRFTYSGVPCDHQSLGCAVAVYSIFDVATIWPKCELLFILALLGWNMLYHTFTTTNYYYYYCCCFNVWTLLAMFLCANYFQCLFISLLMRSYCFIIIDVLLKVLSIALGNFVYEQMYWHY